MKEVKRVLNIFCVDAAREGTSESYVGKLGVSSGYYVCIGKSVFGK
jgi:hypothetical protein